MPRKNETPVSGLDERRGPLKLGGPKSSTVVPCRQCGANVALSLEVLEFIEQMRRRCKEQREEPLHDDEVVVCDRKECKRAEAEESSRRVLRENKQTQAIIDAIKRGEAVTVPAEIVKYRYSCHSRIKQALAARRDGKLPTIDKEIG